MTEYEAAVQYIRLADTVRVLSVVGWDPGATVLDGCAEARRRFDVIRSGRVSTQRRRGWQYRRAA